MVTAPINATGWSELFEGKFFEAAYVMYDHPTAGLGGWFVAILFFVFQSMLYLKTKNLTLCWISGLFFAAMYAATSYMMESSISAIFVLLVLELTGIFFVWVFGDRG